MRKLSTLTATGILVLSFAGAAGAQAPVPGGAAADSHHPEAPAALAMQPFRRIEGQLAYFRAPSSGDREG